MFHHPDRCRWLEHGQNVKSECRSELEPWQHQDTTTQVAILRQQFCFVWPDSAQTLEVCQVLDFVLEPGPASDRVVISEGNDVQTLFGRIAQQIDGPDRGFLIIDGSRGVDVQVCAVPLRGLVGTRRGSF